MSNKKRGIMLKSLDYQDEGMQELINPVPLELIGSEDADLEIDIEISDQDLQGSDAVKDVIEMLQDTMEILDKT
ncbi:MAG: hypothetical protein P8Y20_11310 [Gammaproteobacteria bacterium]|jgi:hypothetical protein